MPDNPKWRWLLPLAAVLLILILLNRFGVGDGVRHVGSALGGAGPAATAPAATPSAEPAGTVSVNGVAMSLGALAGTTGTKLSAYIGKRAVGTGVKVLGVVAGKGFWIGPDQDHRVWVELTGPPAPAGRTVRVGDAVSFAGKVVRTTAGYARAVGDSQAVATLIRQGQHIAVSADAVRVARH